MLRFEVSGTAGISSATAEGERFVIGRSAAADLNLSDPRASRLHAMVERVADGWVLRDLGSANGTLHNGAPLRSDVALRDGDEIIVGDTRIVARLETTERTTHVEVRKPPPRLTPREQEVLEALCGNHDADQPFPEPASLAEMSRALFISEDGVKKLLVRLYEKFDIEPGPGRKGHLARAAIVTGAVRAQARGRDR